MLKEEVWKWFRRMLFKGARPDVKKELRDDGYYENAFAMRPVSVDGNTGAMESVGGEQEYFTPPAQYAAIADGYRCIGAITTSRGRAAFWCHINGYADPVAFPPLITVNQDVVAASPRIPYRFDRPLQFAGVNACQGSVIYPADGNSDALFWDVDSMLQALADDTGEFFQNLNIEAVSVLPAGPRDWFEHIGLPTVGDGLPPGQYIYWPRYITPNGDRTNAGPPSNPISVPRVQSPMNFDGPLAGQYPGGQTAGGEVTPDALTPTPYGIALRIQVYNRLGFSKLEVVRQRFNTGQGLSDAGIVEVVAQIGVADGQFGDIYFTDPVNANFLEVIPPDTAAQQNVSFTAPYTTDYFDNRLGYGNYMLRDRLPDVTWREVDGQRAVPITNRVFTRYGQGGLNAVEYNDGYSDPVNNTYMKSAMHNERISLGMMFWDGYATKSFVSPIVDNFLLPGRRTRKQGESMRLSYNRNDVYGAPPDPIYAANVECQGNDPVSPTFDAIVQGTQRKYNDSYTNVVNIPGLPYRPLNPTSMTDTDFVRYRQMPVEAWNTGSATLDNLGYFFAPQHHALGVAVYGPENVDAALPWWEIMEVMVSPEAGRVVAEGLGAYRLISPRSKIPNVLECHFPDIDSSVVPASVLADIVVNPQNYKLKLVPYGFGSEIYSKRTYQPVPFGPDETRGIDLITYMDVQFDNGATVQNPQWSVNIGESPSTMGFQPAASAPLEPTNYVGFSAWRSTPSPLSSTTSDPNYSVFMDPAFPEGGDRLIGITSLVNVTEGRGSFIRITTDERVYRIDGQTSGADFEDAATRRFHEGMYVVQIIRDGAVVPTQNIQDYRTTGYRVARERIIALGRPAGDVYDVELFHARPEDCVPFPNSGTYRYVYERQQNQDERAYICVTNAAPAFIAVLPAAIAAWSAGLPFTDPNGIETWGGYTYTGDNNAGPRTVHRLTFGGYGSAPSEGSSIIVKYSGDPIQAFGFGNTIAPAVFAPFDRLFDGTTNSLGTSTQHFNPPPMPYSGGRLSVNYALPLSPTVGNNFEDPEFTNIRSIRQWVVWGHVNSRTPFWMNLAGDGTIRGVTFPRRHYVIRPVFAVSTVSGVANGFFPEYDVDYPDEANWFRNGGFWLWSQNNLDYAKQPLITGKGVPRNGERPDLSRCNYYIVSLQRIPGAVGAPGLRTFLSDNEFPISEENGPIKRMMALDQGGFQQLWGWAERGLHRIPYNKNILVGADGNTIGTQSISQFWPREEQWIVRGAKGMPGKTWRMSTKANAPIGGGDHDTAYWCDDTSAYQLIGGQVKDVAFGKYLSVLQPLLRALIADGRPGISSLYNAKQKEWWFTIIDDTSGLSQERVRTRMFAFSAQNGEWIGEMPYLYDQYMADSSRIFGFRELSSNELDVGGSLVTPAGPAGFEKWVEGAFTPYPFMQSELIKWRVGPSKPSEMRIYDTDHVQMVIANQAVQEAFEAGTGQYWVLKVDSYEQMMSNVDAAYDPERSTPPQSTGYYMRVFGDGTDSFVLTFMELQSKQLP